MSGAGFVNTGAQAGTDIAAGKGGAPTVVPASSGSLPTIPTIPIDPATANMYNIAPYPTSDVPTYNPATASAMPQIVQQPLPQSGMSMGMLSQLLQGATPANVPSWQNSAPSPAASAPSPASNGFSGVQAAFANSIGAGSGAGAAK